MEKYTLIYMLYCYKQLKPYKTIKNEFAHCSDLTYKPFVCQIQNTEKQNTKQSTES